MINLGALAAVGGAANAYSENAVKEQDAQRQLASQAKLNQMALDNFKQQHSFLNDQHMQTEKEMYSWQKQEQAKQWNHEADQIAESWKGIPSTEREKSQQDRYLALHRVMGNQADQVMKNWSTYKPEQREDLDNGIEVTKRIAAVKSGYLQNGKESALRDPAVQAMITDSVTKGLNFNDPEYLKHVLSVHFPKQENLTNYVITNPKTGETKNRSVGPNEAIISHDEEKQGWIQGSRQVSANDLTPEEQGAIQSAMTRDKNPLPPSMLKARGSSTKMMAQSLLKDPDYSPALTQQDFDSQKDYNKYMNSSGVQTPLKYLGSVNKSLDEMDKISKQFDRTKFKIANKAELLAKINSGDPVAARYLTVQVETADQIAKILQGGGTGSATSDKKLEQAQQILSSDWSYDQLKGATTELKVLLKNREEALREDTRISPTGSKSKPGKSKPNKDPLGLFGE